MRTMTSYLYNKYAKCLWLLYRSHKQLCNLLVVLTTHTVSVKFTKGLLITYSSLCREWPHTPLSDYKGAHSPISMSQMCSPICSETFK